VAPAIYINAVAELARHDGSVGWCVSIANSIGLFAPYLDLEAACTVFGDPRATCAWGPPKALLRRNEPSGSTTVPRAPIQLACRQPLAKSQRPVTR
jgi:hypothetical protein